MATKVRNMKLATIDDLFSTEESRPFGRLGSKPVFEIKAYGCKVWNRLADAVSKKPTICDIHFDICDRLSHGANAI